MSEVRDGCLGFFCGRDTKSAKSESERRRETESLRDSEKTGREEARRLDEAKKIRTEEFTSSRCHMRSHPWKGADRG